MSFFNSIVLGLVEGITEFIPVSSTGHLIIVGKILNFTGGKAASFEIFIQSGAILAVIFLYRQKFWDLCRIESKNEQKFSGIYGTFLLFLTTAPALILGFLSHHFIKEHLFNPATVAAGLGIGGLWIIIVEKFLPQFKKSGLDSLGWQDALLIGCFQCFALWPGMSRSASTILGAMLIGIDRKTAVEYSFFAAVPVMIAATSYDLYKTVPLLEKGDFLFFSAGFIVSFVSAVLAIRFFIRLLNQWTLLPFGIYRIIISPIIFLTMK